MISLRKLTTLCTAVVLSAAGELELQQISFDGDKFLRQVVGSFVHGGPPCS